MIYGIHEHLDYMEKTALYPLTAMKTISRCRLNHTNGDVMVNH